MFGLTAPQSIRIDQQSVPSLCNPQVTWFQPKTWCYIRTTPQQLLLVWRMANSMSFCHLGRFQASVWLSQLFYLQFRIDSGNSPTGSWAQVQCIRYLTSQYNFPACNLTMTYGIGCPDELCTFPCLRMHYLAKYQIMGVFQPSWLIINGEITWKALWALHAFTHEAILIVSHFGNPLRPSRMWWLSVPSIAWFLLSTYTEWDACTTRASSLWDWSTIHLRLPS